VVSYPRRQQYRRLVRAGGAAIGSMTAVLVALALASAGATSVAALLMVAAIAFAFYARHWLGLAGRSRVGARSEAEVRRVLSALEAEGWRVRHSLRWRGAGDVDSVAIAPTGVAFVVEAKTRAYDERHLGRVREQAAWLWRRRRRWCRQGAVPSLCVVQARGAQRWEAGVLVVSIEWLIPTLRHAAGRNVPQHAA
jgi:Nuclease-related domain